MVSPKETVAVKVYAMEILYRISQVEPEVKKELADRVFKTEKGCIFRIK